MLISKGGPSKFEFALAYDSSTLVAENDGEDALSFHSGQFAGLAYTARLQRTSGSLPLRVYSSVWQIPANEIKI